MTLAHKKHLEVSILSASIKICVKELSKKAFLFYPPIKKLTSHPGQLVFLTMYDRVDRPLDILCLNRMINHPIF
ncbi:MAG: hypothetical protein A2V86_17965 [Deltaproteobacteria bacterium RBG_16_49_23]|nr:MAG: hypothetical protein A2V86_17965 [Deltaproteobacteria bacterium RBG_16_49_23]